MHLICKAFDIIISSQPLSTNVLQEKLSVGPPTFPLKTSKACLFESLLSLYGENVQTFMVVPLNSFCSFMSFSFLYFLSFCSFGSFISFSLFLYFSCGFFSFLSFSFLLLSAVVHFSVSVPRDCDGLFSFLHLLLDAGMILLDVGMTYVQPFCIQSTCSLS